MVKPQFHGSDLEQISKYYKIPKEEIINFGANVNPIGLSDTVRAQLSKHLDVITTYPDRDYKELRTAISKYCHVAYEHIMVGNGTTELISLLINSLSPKQTLLLGPTYSEYERELHIAGSTVKKYHLRACDDFQLNSTELYACLDDTIDLFIICNPNNPTSSALTCEEMQHILTICRKHQIFVMIDETYVEFAPDVEAISASSLVAEFDNFMILRGLSKFFAAPGLRLGYGMTSNIELLKRLKEQQNPWSLNSLASYAGVLMLQDKDYITQTRTLISSERNRTCQALKDCPNIKVYEPTANFILVQLVSKELTATSLFEVCIKKGLMIRDCSSFENLDGEFIRFCIMLPEDNDRLIQTIIDAK